MDEYFTPTSKDHFLISGLPDADTSGYLANLYSSSPIEMLPPVVYFSSLTESCFGSGSIWERPYGPSQTFEPIHVEVQTYSFKNLYNPILRRTELCAALLLADGSRLADFRKAHFGIDPDPDFVPYFVIARDPVRSSASRSFCLSVANALHKKRTLAFELIPTSLPAITGNYNAEATSPVFPPCP